ncbi:hypothetical protein PM082_022209 [Marasmius tenuissimus]|nr:hypothetical protein PM082_022209 [Marasmius tenuissimus]
MTFYPSLSPPSANTSPSTLTYPPTPLRRETRPQLYPVDIAACIESQLGDFLHAIASSGGMRQVEELSDFARHGLLTFGAVVNRGKPGILAHVPFTPHLKWHFKNFIVGSKAVYSATVPWRIDLLTSTPQSQLHLHFSLHFPDDIRQRTAYIAQSHPFANGWHNLMNNLVFITNIHFSLVGTIHNSRPSSTPIYLFVPPVPVEYSSGLYSIRYPLVKPLFYWSFDPNGRQAISEDDWGKHGVPRLKVISWIGSSWETEAYNIVHNHLQTKKYDLDGRQYARERGYLELIHGDPHKRRIFDLEDLDTAADSSGPSLLHTSNTRVMRHKQLSDSVIVKKRRTNPRIARYIQIITTRKQSSRRFMKTTRGFKASSSASSHGAQRNGAKKRRRD